MIEHLLGTPVEAAIRERVLTPLGLEHSVFFAWEAITYPNAVGHNKLPGKPLEVARPYPLMRCMNAAGGIIGTAGDLLRFARFHMDGGTVDGTRVLSDASIAAMQTPQIAAGSFADAYGIGWALRTIDGARVVGHGGSTNGFRAQLTLAPEQGFAIALLTNGSGGAALNREVEAWALERLAGLRGEPPAVVTLPPKALARVAGRYEQPLTEITVTVDGDALRLDVISKSALSGITTEMPPMRAEPLSDTRFVIAGGESDRSTVDFIGDGPAPRFIRLHGRLADRVGDA